MVTADLIFPNLPQVRIIISDILEENIEQELAFAKDTTLAVREVVIKADEGCTIEVLQQANVSKEDYIKALSISKAGRTVILKRFHQLNRE